LTNESVLSSIQAIAASMAEQERPVPAPVADDEEAQLAAAIAASLAEAAPTPAVVSLEQFSGV
jgi:hypothetical protein